MKNKLTGSAALVLATIIWGSTFVAQSVGMDYIGPFTFQATRCMLAVLFLVPVIAVLERKNRKQHKQKWMDKQLWIAGVLCGLALFVASTLQQIGLVYTDAGKAGFLTAMYIVLVPLLGLFLKKKPSIVAVISIIPAVIGLYLLSCIGVTTINTGDLLLMGCALAFAVQITLIDKFAATADTLRLNCIQSLVVAVLSAVFMALTEQPDMGNILSCWLPIGYAGVLSLGVAYSLQIVGQKHLEATTASIIMSLESVVAALCGWLLLEESMTPWELTGCALVFAAVILSQIPVKPTKNAPSL